jgi:uncharacterized protein YndB with AHSA1/START domain
MTGKNDRTAVDPRAAWALDREIVLTRVIDAPREQVFAAWTQPDQIRRWFSPEGFTNETHEIDIRPGGRWRFTYVAPDGKRWENRMVFLRIEEPGLIEFEHGSDVDDDPARFRVTVTFDAQGNGKTVLTLRQLHPTAELRSVKIGFGAVEIGMTTLDKLERLLRAG